jgi:hypothetical protein
MPLLRGDVENRPETRAVISHKVLEKPRPIEDLAAEVAKLKGAAAAATKRSRNRSKRKNARESAREEIRRAVQAGQREPRQDPPKRDIDL